MASLLIGNFAFVAGVSDELPRAIIIDAGMISLLHSFSFSQ